MRFDSDERIEAWQRSGVFPEIHDDIFHLFLAEVHPSDGLVLDLGASIGLLSRRMKDAGFDVVAVEPDLTATRKGREAGIYDGIQIRSWKILGQDVDEVAYWLKGKGVKIIMARRVLSELDTSGMTPAVFTAAAYLAGVEHIFLEGRAPRTGTTHRLDCLEKELNEIDDQLWARAKYDGPHRVHLMRRA